MKLLPTFFNFAVFYFLFLLVPISLLAQKKGRQDVVYLKNGSIIRGTLLVETALETIKIETVGRNVFVFSKTEVAQVTSEPIKSYFKYPAGPSYLNITEVGISIGNPPQSGFTTALAKDFTLHTFNGYQLVPAFAAGISLGLDTYNEITLLPIGLGIRGDILKTKTRPFYGFDTGYALDWLSNANLPANHNGGFMWSPSLGFKFSSAKSNTFILSFGYKNQKETSTQRDGLSQISQKNTFKRGFLRAGLSF